MNVQWLTFFVVSSENVLVKEELELTVVVEDLELRLNVR